MAIIGSSYLDLLDVYRSQDKHGNIIPVIEMLHQMNPILQDALTVECNQGLSHTHSVRTGLPSVAWGMLYKGIPQSKSTRAQVTDTTGFAESMSSVDQRLLNITKNAAALRLSEAQAHLEAMNQEIATRIFYGNSNADPEQFMGLAPRFNDTTAPNGNQIVLAGNGSDGDNTSVWFVAWGDNACHLLHPEGTPAGVHREDMGRQRVTDGDGNPYFVEEELFRWHIGLAVKDWRYVVRIANIDVSELQAGNIDIYRLMRKAYYRLQSRLIPGGRVAIYANRDVMEALDGLATNQGGSGFDNFVRLTPREIEGKEVLTYRGMPVRETDALLNNEAAVA